MQFIFSSGVFFYDHYFLLLQIGLIDIEKNIVFKLNNPAVDVIIL